MKAADLSPEDRTELCNHVRTAMYHMASCWDALRQAENILEEEIETDDISGITCGIDDPAEAFEIPDVDILDNIQEAVDA